MKIDKIKWYSVSIILAILYTSYILLSQCLITNYKLNPSTIFVNVIFIAALLCIISKPNDLLLPQMNIKYLLVIFIGILIYFQNFFLQIGTNLPINFGIIDAFAISIYLPLVTFLLVIFFKEKITLKKCIGILFACLAGYLILY